MAKIRRFKLAWNASDSDTVAGYKLYWSEGLTIGYDSQSIDVGNVRETHLPDGPILFGATAIDKSHEAKKPVKLEYYDDVGYRISEISFGVDDIFLRGRQS